MAVKARQLKQDGARMMAFEMKGLRQIMSHGQQRKPTYEFYSRQEWSDLYCSQSIKDRKLKFCGHVLRKQEESLEKDILEGQCLGYGEEADQGYHGEITLGIGIVRAPFIWEPTFQI